MAVEIHECFLATLDFAKHLVLNVHSNAKIVDAPVIRIDKRVRVNYNGEGLYFDANIRVHSEKGYLVEYIDYSGEHDRYEDGVPPERVIGK